MFLKIERSRRGEDVVRNVSVKNVSVLVKERRKNASILTFARTNDFGVL